METQVYRECDGSRSTTRNNLSILPGQIILVRRFLGIEQTAIIVSFLSKLTKESQKTITAKEIQIIRN